MKLLRTFTCCATATIALVLISSQAAADLATPFVETTPVGGTSKEYGYLVSLGPQGTHFLVIVRTDQLQYRVLHGVADKGVVEDSVLGKRAVIQARVLKKQRDEDRGHVNVELKITRVWPDAERPSKGSEGKTSAKEDMLPRAGLKEGILKWGPVIERTVNDPHGPGPHCLIDFDTGRVLAWPTDGLRLFDSERRYTDGFKRFMATNGLDAVAWAKSGADSNGLVGFGMTVLPVENDQWDMDPRLLAERLASVKPREQQTIRGAKVRPDPGKTPTTTYLFQTREGRTGVLQVTLATPSIKVRYKLSETPGKIAASRPKLSLAQKVAAADAIVVGKVVAIEAKRYSLTLFKRGSDGKKPATTTLYDLAVLHPETVLKADCTSMVRGNPTAQMHMAFETRDQPRVYYCAGPSAGKGGYRIWFLRHDTVLTGNYFLKESEAATDAKVEEVKKLVAAGGPEEVATASKDDTTPRKTENAPKEIETPEIIRILEKEALALIYTSHSQRIHISLKDGREFAGKYEQERAGEYSKDPKMFDILNLAKHILSTRPQAELKGMSFIME